MSQKNTSQPILTRENNRTEVLRLYFNEIEQGGHKPLSVNEETDLYPLIKSGDEKAKHKLATSNLRFVITIAKGYQGHGLNLSDLIQEGNLGLIKKIDKFDDTRGFRFYSYAVNWVRESILKSIDENSRLIRIPPNKICSIRKKRKKPILEEEQEVPEEEFSLKTVRDSYAEDAFDQKYIPIGVKSNCNYDKPFDVGYDHDFYADMHKEDIKSFVQNEVLPLLKEEAQNVMVRWARGEKLNEKEMQLKMYSLMRLKKQIKKEKLLEYLSY